MRTLWNAADYARVLALFQRARWLKHAAPQTHEYLIGESSLVRFRKGELIATQGTALEHLTVVVTGTVEVSSGTVRGRRFVQSYVAPGEPFSLIGMIDGKGAIHVNRAHENCEVLRIPKAQIMLAMQRDAQLLQSVLRLLAQRARGLHESLFDASMLPLTTRLARLLLSLAAAYGTEDQDEGRLLGLRVSQEDLASMIGVTRQRLNVELKRMEREGLLRLSYSRIVLLDDRRLATQAQELVE